MVETVKRKPGRREAKAQATRERVLDAALALFVADGYSATPISSIADAADVAVQTVYAIFRNKRAILQGVLARAVVGDDEAGPLRERADWQAMELEPDPIAQLTQLAAIATNIGARMAPLYEVLSDAASSDPEIAETFRRQQQGRWDDQQWVAKSLSRRRALRKGIDAGDATDILWTVASPRTYHSLVTQRGWNTQKYEQWLAATLSAILLPDR